MEQITLQTPDMPPARSRHIVGTALAYAIPAIDAFSEEETAASDRDDMWAILLANFSEFDREAFAARPRQLSLRVLALKRLAQEAAVGSFLAGEPPP